MSKQKAKKRELKGGRDQWTIAPCCSACWTRWTPRTDAAPGRGWRGEGECGDYAIRGRRGHIYRDGDGFLLYVTERSEQKPSAIRWNLAKQRLAFCTLTQDGDWEGCLRLDRLSAPEEAAIIRKVLRIKRRRHPTAAHLDQLRRMREAR
jgi:hypothetical protein